ncbi:22503_t:CDS:2 [Dentiscutata erythropus]|uniref:22503_t:CDS:1 n=1 Tax=Dentiscutata erythropus TaxID=1348616 RepID=A0A9N9DD41_9GLOM|nr:22503_t:CDS:2 [Dentiscutata erythropus]
MRLSLVDDQMNSNEKWIENRIIEGRINVHKMDEFEDYKFINGGAFSKVYRARFKSTKNLCALKIIEENDHTNKEILNEHPNNILIHQETLKLADFGLSRQEPIADTPREYVTIYEWCWKSDQVDRPSIEEVVTELESIRPSIKEATRVFEDNIVQDVIANCSFNICDISESEEYIENANNKFDQVDMALFVNNLYSTLDKQFNEGRSVSDIIINFISKSGKTNEEVFQWLSGHSNCPKYYCLLGLFYHWNIGTDKKVASFHLFFIAAGEDSIAQYFVGKCYAEGRNTNKNLKNALDWYNKAAENKCAAAGCFLGEYFYKLGRYTKAFDFLKKAVENGSLKALNTLGLCYQKGQGTGANVVEGFKSFEKAAKNGLPASQFELGNCYEYGIGTETNLKKALHWYKEATKVDYNYKTHLTRVESKIHNNK